MRRFLLFLFSMALFGLTVVLMLPVLRSTSVRTARAVAAADSDATAAGCVSQAVYAYRIGSLRLDRRQVAFGEVAEGCPVEVRIRVVNDGNQPLELSVEGLPSCIAFRCEPAHLEPGGEGTLWFRAAADGSMPKGGFSHAVLLVGTGEERPSECSVRLTGRML